MDQHPANSLADAVQLWSLSSVSLIADTASSRVYRACKPDGTLAALKILKPYGVDEIVGVRAMRWWAGDGAATILAVEGLMILMEWLDGAPLGDMIRTDAARDDEATAILCDVLAALHQPRGRPPEGLDPLRRRFGPLLDGRPEDWPEAHRPNAGRAVALATELLATTGDAIPLHGDLHHDNIVGSVRGWLAIDPKGVLGDRHYDVSNVFRNPYGADDLALQPKRIGALADRFAARLGFERRRVLQWAAAHCALSECWNRQGGNELAFNLTLLPILLDAVDRSP